MNLDTFMSLAIDEARVSLREGNNGFGVVIIKDKRVISSAHDREYTEDDSTCHASFNAIREASRSLGSDLSGCALVSTHEPCPMCTMAIVRSGVSEVAYGYSIAESARKGRNRPGFGCLELLNRVKANIKIQEGILEKECSVLYRDDVRREVSRLRNTDDKRLAELDTDSKVARLRWFKETRDTFDFIDHDTLYSGYRLLLERFHITDQQAPVIARSERKLVFHSKNFCPTLEACRILGLDTRTICKRLNETATDALVKQVDPRLRFSRNYEKIRPFEDYCEEMITLE